MMDREAFGLWCEREDLKQFLPTTSVRERRQEINDYFEERRRKKAAFHAKWGPMIKRMAEVQ